MYIIDRHIILNQIPKNIHFTLHNIEAPIK